MIILWNMSLAIWYQIFNAIRKYWRGWNFYNFFDILLMCTFGGSHLSKKFLKKWRGGLHVLWAHKPKSTQKKVLCGFYVRQKVSCGFFFFNKRLRAYCTGRFGIKHISQSSRLSQKKPQDLFCQMPKPHDTFLYFSFFLGCPLSFAQLFCFLIFL